MIPDRKRFRLRNKYLYARASELAGPALRVLSKWRTGPPTPPNEWRRGIIIGADHIGDVLYNSASLPFLHRGFPNCAWYYVSSPPANEVLINNPALAGSITRGALVKEPPFDVAICYNSGSAAQDLILAVQLKIPNRVGYVDKGFSGLVTHPIEIDFPQPHPAYFRGLVAQLIGFKPDWSLRPLIYPMEQDAAEAQLFHSELKLTGRPLIACFATSRQGTGVWPADDIASLLRKIHEQADCRSVLFGAASDEALLLSLKKMHDLPSTIAAGRLRLRALACFLKKTALVICPDSGPRHIANAASVPVFFVRNLAVRKIETGSYLETEHDLAPDFECVPPSGQSACFGLINRHAAADEASHFMATR